MQIFDVRIRIFIKSSMCRYNHESHKLRNFSTEKRNFDGKLFKTVLILNINVVVLYHNIQKNVFLYTKVHTLLGAVIIVKMEKCYEREAF